MEKSQVLKNSIQNLKLMIRLLISQGVIETEVGKMLMENIRRVEDNQLNFVDLVKHILDKGEKKHVHTGISTKLEEVHQWFCGGYILQVKDL